MYCYYFERVIELSLSVASLYRSVGGKKKAGGSGRGGRLHAAFLCMQVFLLLQHLQTQLYYIDHVVPIPIFTSLGGEKAYNTMNYLRPEKKESLHTVRTYSVE